MFINLHNAHIEIMVSHLLAIQYLGTLALLLWPPPLLLGLLTQFTL